MESNTQLEQEEIDFLDIIAKSNPINQNDVQFNSPVEQEQTDIPSSTLNIPNNIMKPIGHSGIYDSTSSLQRWKGVISRVESGFFYSELEDLTSPGLKESESFQIDEIPLDDQPLIKPGAVFYWSIGNFFKKTTIHNASEIRFQRAGELSQSQFEEAMDSADSIADQFGWD